MSCLQDKYILEIETKDRESIVQTVYSVTSVPSRVDYSFSIVITEEATHVNIGSFFFLGLFLLGSLSGGASGSTSSSGGTYNLI